MALSMRQVFMQLQRRDGHDATIVQSWWRVLLSGTSSLWKNFWLYEYVPKRNGGNGCLSLKRTCRPNLVWHCVTFCEHGQLKGWQPHFQPAVAKSSISTSVRWFVAVSYHNWEHKHCIVTNLGDHNSLTKPSASLHETGFFYLFLQLQRRDGHDATTTKCRAGERTAALGNSSFW